jgi:hypothetical protein
LLALPGTQANGLLLAFDVPVLTLAIGWLWWLSVSFVDRSRGDAGGATAPVAF